ncbi:MAG: hypothetical protein RO469_05745 [Thermincola sp.]|jgi:vacuolar-type H+-ATPase subunit I/STV1|nr:hypothetical protein [Thermincola sp.]MDT3701703.1 hypothetical protein [Thermincola sp.]
MSIIRRCVAASFIVGLLAGAAILNVVSGKHIDNAELEIHKLQTKSEDQVEQIAALEKALAEALKKRQKLAVTEIEVHVTFKAEEESNEYNQLEIEKAVKKLLKDIRGKEVSSLDPLIIANIVDGRTVEAAKRKFTLSVKGIAVSEKVIMYVETTEIPQANM